MKGRIVKLVVAALLGLLGPVVHAAGTVTYVYTDPQGTPLAEANASGTITATFDYKPYGAQAIGAPTPGPGYTGHVNDPDTGFVYMQARYYDPGVGRFLSVDPVGPAAGNVYSVDRYAYANDNPVINIDPTGTTCQRNGSRGAYSCQIDYVAQRIKDRVVIRVATAADHKAYAAVEKSLTSAVNKAANSGKVLSISFKSGGTKFAFLISARNIAKNLVNRSMIVDPKSKAPGAMYSMSRHYTYIDKGGINVGHTKFGSPNRTRSMYFLHEGIHWSLEEERALGNSLPTLGTDPKAHQDSYDNAANEILGK